LLVDTRALTTTFVALVIGPSFSKIVASFASLATFEMTEVQRLGRLPLQSRNPNTIGALGSFNNSSTEGYDSKEIGLSKLESSCNENNKKLTSSASYGATSLRRHNSSNDVRDAPEAAGASRSGTTPHPAVVSRSSSVPSVTAADEESVIIEEKRRRVNGEGYTLHRYLRGRLLGKGGFAKVYLCTALDTNKAYAVKIVPKANLVKSRARQKVRYHSSLHRPMVFNSPCFQSFLTVVFCALAASGNQNSSHTETP
jgi:hypothetical protein